MKSFNFRLSFLLPIFLVLFSSCLYAVPTCTKGASVDDLVDRIEGVGITITNAEVHRGSGDQVGLFSNGESGANLEIDKGIILSTMSIDKVCTTNSLESTSDDFIDITPDDDLLAIDSRATHDTVVFEFDVTLDANTRLLLVDYQFASEEYNEYVGSIYNDAFGFFISGGDLIQTYNIARVVDDQTYVTINSIDDYDTVTVNNVNNGTRGSQDSGEPVILTNSAFFIDNTVTPNPVEVEYDGLTHTLHATLDNLTPGETYHFKMAIADVGDSAWDTGVFVNKISGLTEPSICYDYAYKQGNTYLTEGYDSVKGPYISGDVSLDSNITVAMYILNTRNSEIIASNVKLDILDINTTQAIYERNTVSVVQPGDAFATTILDSPDLNVSDSYIKDIPIDSFDAYEYFYTYFNLQPQMGTLSLPINARINYDLIIPVSTSGDTITIPRSSLIDTEVPICGGGSTTFDPVYGLFNIIENALYTNNTTYDYNLNTQVTGRKGDLSIITIDDNLTSNPDLHTITTGVKTVVGVDMLDMKSFHYTGASCSEVGNAINDRTWVVLDTDGVTAFNPADTTFYSTARENVALRISYNINDDTEDLVQLEEVEQNGEKRWNVLNFSDAVKIGECSVDIANGTDTVAQWCSNSGTNFNSAMTLDELATCMECVYGYNTKLLCARDNFSIRPEAYLITIKDQNQTNSTNPLTPPITLSSGSATKLNLAAGYQYSLEVNATNHQNNVASKGYNIHLGYTAGSTGSPGTNAEYIWSPSPTRIVSDCNDTTDKYFTAKFINGVSDMNSSLNQAGEYLMKFYDSAWTKIDSVVQSHHSLPYFRAGSDCVLNSSFVAAQGNPDNINGCDISSNHSAAALDSNITYSDANITFHPYEFDMSGLTISRGTDDNISFNTNSIIYMNDVSVNDNMAFHIFNNISAVGYSGIRLSNFTDNCYAESIRFDINASDISGVIAYKSTFNTFDENNISNINLPAAPTATNNPWIKDINNSRQINGSQNAFWIAPATSFDKDNRGVITITQNMNFDRNRTIAMNPEQLTFTTYDVNCTTPANCTMNADLKVNHTTSGSRDLNQTDAVGNPINARLVLTHLYGRTHASRQRYEVRNDGEGHNANIYYEAYCFGTIGLAPNSNTCNKNLLPNGMTSTRTDDIRWYINTQHDVLSSGMAGTITQRGANDINATTPTNAAPSVTTLRYNANQGYPYKGTMENNASRWLIYNENDPTATRNNFSVEFYKSGGSWSGTNTMTTNVDDNKTTVKTNRRSMW